MKFEKPTEKQKKERAISDGDFLKEGGDIREDSSIDIAEEQKIRAKDEMEKAMEKDRNIPSGADFNRIKVEHILGRFEGIEKQISPLQDHPKSTFKFTKGTYTELINTIDDPAFSKKLSRLLEILNSIEIQEEE